MNDMSDFEQLKPCPFCGGEVKLEQTLKRTGWEVVCRNSSNLGGTCAIEQIPSKEKQAAITRWNTRAAKQSMHDEAIGYISEHTRKFLLSGSVGYIFPQLLEDSDIELYTHAPDSAARIAEQDAEIARLTKELGEARAMVDGLLAHCPDAECFTCGEIICPHKEPLHFHHDGCPACAQHDAALSKIGGGE